jgi:hypothetical protein
MRAEDDELEEDKKLDEGGGNLSKVGEPELEDVKMELKDENTYIDFQVSYTQL